MNRTTEGDRSGELRRSPLSVIDDSGAVFFSGGRVLRAVSATAAERLDALLASRCLAELVERRWTPRCRRVNERIGDCAFVIEQERLPVVSYPYEWSYGMMRDAAVRVLEINALARRHGWELKDCHGFNVVFDGPEPQWVDLGSFVPLPEKAAGWPAYEEFLRSYEYPLRIWSDGGEFLGRRLVAAGEPMSHGDYGLYRWPWLRWAGASAYQQFWTSWYRVYRQLPRISPERIRRRLPGPTGRVLAALNARGWLPWQNLSMERLRKRTGQRRRRGPRGRWGDYQDLGPQFVATPRFRRIADLLRQMQATSIVELGGNQGWLAEQLLRDGVVRQAVCTDADETAVDLAYARTQAAGGKLHTAVLDFVFPLATPFGEPPAARLMADVACALAVTHHLLLAQRIPLDRVLRSIGAYASRLVFVEFMPLGLWDGRSAPPLPEWYRVEWFREEFARHFVPLHEESIEENRILFCGAVRRPIGAAGP